MSTEDAELWKQVDQLLKRRPGWRFQAMSTPGAPPVWCLGPEHQPDLSVRVEGGSICVYVTKTDHDVLLGGTDQLIVWLNDYWPGSLGDQRGGALEKFKRGHLFEWE